MLTYALQKEGDAIDVRNILHRDGSVVSAVSLSQLANPDKLYYDMGCKTAVGMPFKVLLSLLALLVQITSANVYYHMGCKTAVGMPFKVVLLGLLALLVQMYKY
jgi:hypothetical protein